MKIEVAFALPDKQFLKAIEVPPGTTMIEAVEISGVKAEFPQIDFEHLAMGIFSKIEANPKEYQLSQGDRVEIYRPLIIDPKESRRQRAEKAKQNRK